MQKRKVIVVSDTADDFDPLQDYLAVHQIEYERQSALSSLDGNNFIDHHVIIVSSDEFNAYRNSNSITAISEFLKSTYIIAYEHSNSSNSLKMAIQNGAADYLTVPIDVELISHKIAAYYKMLTDLQDRYTQELNAITFNNLSIDPVTKQIVLKGNRLDLTHSEFNILYTLAKKPNEVFDMEFLFQMITGQKSLGDYNALMTHVSRLRKKLAKIDVKHQYIITVRNKGYKFNPFGLNSNQ
ncbi:MAG TPA: hypothetical protein DCS67_08885 [Clostridiales bacterium UBA8960]|jgi:DNA-binding response OmpR family regulator|nr:hypothetical protein [Clostridiales bacterium UBA8960]